jgi:hypothetical protein
MIFKFKFMIRIFTLSAALFVLFSSNLTAQIYLENRQRKTILLDTISAAHYINANIVGIPFSSMVYLNIDCGLQFDDVGSWRTRGGFRVVDKKGVEIKFESRMDALNFLYWNGWVYKSTFLLISDGDSDERHTFERKGE